jgi:hypothetical protein
LFDVSADLTWGVSGTSRTRANKVDWTSADAARGFIWTKLFFLLRWSHTVRRDLDLCFSEHLDHRFDIGGMTASAAVAVPFCVWAMGVIVEGDRP